MGMRIAYQVSKKGGLASERMQEKLSVVIGASNARATIFDCLSELEIQRKGRNVEIIVVDNSADGTAEIVENHFPTVKVLKCPELSLVPELWEKGIEKSTGEIVAILAADCIPGPKWIEWILRMHESTCVGVGGALENDPNVGVVAWAVYFCRYSRYMLPLKETTVGDFAGDNASYKRWALELCPHVRKNGFWEHHVNACLRRGGFQLLLTPEVVVYHKGSYSVTSFIKNRFWHGREFGMTRAEEISVAKRFVYMLLTPFIPVLLCVRISGRIMQKRRHRVKLIMSMPVLFLFVSGWAVGELAGYLSVGSTSDQVDSARMEV